MIVIVEPNSEIYSCIKNIRLIKKNATCCYGNKVENKKKVFITI